MYYGENIEVIPRIQSESKTAAADKSGVWVCVKGKAMHSSLVLKAL